MFAIIHFKLTYSVTFPSIATVSFLLIVCVRMLWITSILGPKARTCERNWTQSACTQHTGYSFCCCRLLQTVRESIAGHLSTQLYDPQAHKEVWKQSTSSQFITPLQEAKKLLTQWGTLCVTLFRTAVFCEWAFKQHMVEVTFFFFFFLMR